MLMGEARKLRAGSLTDAAAFLAALRSFEDARAPKPGDGGGAAWELGAD